MDKPFFVDDILTYVIMGKAQVYVIKLMVAAMPVMTYWDIYWDTLL